MIVRGVMVRTLSTAPAIPQQQRYQVQASDWLLADCLPLLKSIADLANETSNFIARKRSVHLVVGLVARLLQVDEDLGDDLQLGRHRAAWDDDAEMDRQSSAGERPGRLLHFGVSERSGHEAAKCQSRHQHSRPFVDEQVKQGVVRGRDRAAQTGLF
jgi:hypothetical protein